MWLCTLKQLIDDDDYIRTWIVNALIFNLPDEFIFLVPKCLARFMKSKNFWTETYFPKETFSDFIL